MNQTEKTKLYNRLKRRLGYWEFCFAVVYLLLLIFSGATFDVRDWAMSLPGGAVVWVAVYFVIMTVCYQTMTLPMDILSGYTLEKRFGLLNQSLRAWAVDQVKANLLSLILGLVAVELLYLFFRWAGPWWWLPAGGAFAVFFILLAQLTPVLILPIFFKFKPLPESDFTRRLTALCIRAGAKVLGVYEWGLAAKTDRANAALVGWGPTRRVVLSDSLLNKFNPSEIEVILAHELGHFRLGHLTKLMGLQVILTFFAFAAADTTFRWIGPTMGLVYLGDVAGMPLLALAFVGVGLVSMPLANAVSRRLERQADYFALSLTGLVGSFISAMEHLAALNMAELEPHPVVECLFHSHPSPAKRIQAAKNYMRQQVRKPE